MLSESHPVAFVDGAWTGTEETGRDAYGPGQAAGLLVERPVRSTERRQLVGIIGGMGPLASVELLNTVYRLCLPAVEQDAPRILLWSDPDVADRTEAIESDKLGPLCAALERSIRGLLDAGAETLVVACMTAHYVFDRLPPELAARCVSLVEVVFDELERRAEPHLLLCTHGTATSGLFTAHKRSRRLGSLLVSLGEADQVRLHRHIYRLKRGSDPGEMIELLQEDFLPRYGIWAFVAGCTELHLVTRAIGLAGLADALPYIDPLAIVAQRIADGAL